MLPLGVIAGGQAELAPSLEPPPLQDPARARAEFPRLRNLGVSEVFVMLWGQDSGLEPHLKEMERIRDAMTS